MEFIPDTLKESRTVEISLLEDHDSKREEEETTNEISVEQGLLTLAEIIIHELPMKIQDTSSKCINNK